MRWFPETRRGRARLIVLLSVVVLPVLAYLLWSPGETVTDGRNDLGTNGVWMSHRWLGDDAWFTDNNREALRDRYRDPAYIDSTLGMLAGRGVVDLMPHLCPCDARGNLHVHWEEPYFREVARRCDHLAVMMYDTSIPVGKPYIHLMARWTRQVLDWSEGRPVLLGLPAYDDAGTGYHHPEVENLKTGLAGVHAGLARVRSGAGDSLPGSYRGVALYSLWEMDEAEWTYYDSHFADPAHARE